MKRTNLTVVLLVLSLVLVSFPQIEVKADDSLIYLKADGSVVPSTAPIQRNGNFYSFTDRIINQTIIVERSNIVIDGVGFKLGSNILTERGLSLSNVSNVTIQNMELQNFKFGIYLENSVNCVITNSTLINDVISFNRYDSDGFNLENSSNCLIENNTLTISSIVLDNSPNNVISNNTLNEGNIEFLLSYNNTFTENRIYGGSFYRRSEYGGIHVDIEDFANSIDTSNQVDGAPVYYLVNQTDLIIDSNTTSQIAALNIVNCDNITVKDVKITQTLPVVFSLTKNSALINCTVIDDKGYDGIVMYNSSDNLITHNTINTTRGYYQNFGLYTFGDDCINNTISNNFVVGQWGGGLKSGSYGVISGNIITLAETGMHIGGDGNKLFDNEVNSTVMAISRGVFADSGKATRVSGNNNEIFRNTFRNNGLALDMIGSNCTIYQNNFINNTEMISIHNDQNHWDNGTTGNYWSDYNGTDNDGDGIGDTPYIIDENNQDNYPLMEPLAIPEFPSYVSLVVMLIVVTVVSFIYRRNGIPEEKDEN